MAKHTDIDTRECAGCVKAWADVAGEEGLDGEQVAWLAPRIMRKHFNAIDAAEDAAQRRAFRSFTRAAQYGAPEAYRY